MGQTQSQPKCEEALESKGTEHPTATVSLIEDDLKVDNLELGIASLSLGHFTDGQKLLEADDPRDPTKAIPDQPSYQSYIEYEMKQIAASKEVKLAQSQRDCVQEGGSLIDIVGKMEEARTVYSNKCNATQKHKPSRKLPVPNKNRGKLRPKVDPAAAFYDDIQVAIKNLIVDTTELQLDPDTRIQDIENLLNKAIQDPETLFSSMQPNPTPSPKRILELKRSRSGTHLRVTKPQPTFFRTTQAPPESSTANQYPEKPAPIAELPSFTKFLKQPQSVLDNYGRLTTFMPFPRLPVELRLAIWKLARPEPQIIRLKKKSKSDGVYSTGSIPGIVHACSESREFAIQHWYGLVRTSRYQLPIKFFFDPAHDFIYVGCEDCNELICDKCRRYWPFTASQKAQKIVTNWPDEQRNFGPGASPFVRLAICYPAARDVILLSPSSNALKPGTRLCELQASSEAFSWQGGRSLNDSHLEEAKQQDGKPWIFQLNSKISCMELAINAESSKRYGFMREMFVGIDVEISPPKVPSPRDISAALSERSKEKWKQRQRRRDEDQRLKKLEYMTASIRSPVTKKKRSGKILIGANSIDLWGRLGAVTAIDGHCMAEHGEN